MPLALSSLVAKANAGEKRPCLLRIGLSNYISTSSTRGV